MDTASPTRVRLTDAPQPASTPFGTAAIMGGLYGDGIIGSRARSTATGSQQLREDIDGLFEDALRTSRRRGRTRPEALLRRDPPGGHPRLRRSRHAPLGRRRLRGGPRPRLQDRRDRLRRARPRRDAPALAPRLPRAARDARRPAAELARVQPHRRRRRPRTWARSRSRRARSGTTPAGFEHEMFPPKSLYPRYEARAQRKMPKMGDISARSALTIHRGTANDSDKSRPVLVLGVDAPDARNAERHDLQFTPRVLRRAARRRCKPHLTCRVVDRLEPIVAGPHDRGLDDGRGVSADTAREQGFDWVATGLRYSSRCLTKRPSAACSMRSAIPRAGRSWSSCAARRRRRRPSPGP